MAQNWLKLAMKSRGELRETENQRVYFTALLEVVSG
jgi:hypothetical protein